jgi:hypothetical protein
LGVKWEGRHNKRLSVRVPSASGTLLVAAMLLFVPSHQAESLAQQLGPTTAQAEKGNEIILPDDRLVVGVVEEVRDHEVKVNTGELMPRFLSLKEGRQNQGRPLIKGDLLEIWVNNQDLVVGYHPLDTFGWHRIIRGTLVQPLAVDQEWAVIKPARSKEEAFAIRPLAKSKVAALPIGEVSLFLIDKTNKIVDATFGSEQALRQAIRGWQGSPPTGVDREIRGTFVESRPSNQVTIQRRRADIRGPPLPVKEPERSCQGDACDPAD